MNWTLSIVIKILSFAGEKNCWIEFSWQISGAGDDFWRFLNFCFYWGSRAGRMIAEANKCLIHNQVAIGNLVPSGMTNLICFETGLWVQKHYRATVSELLVPIAKVCYVSVSVVPTPNAISVKRQRHLRSALVQLGLTSLFALYPTRQIWTKCEWRRMTIQLSLLLMGYQHISIYPVHSASHPSELHVLETVISDV